MKNETTIKTERLTELLASENSSGVLLSSQANFAWLTGGAKNGVDLSSEGGAFSLLVSQNGRRFVLANKIEMPRVLAEEVSEDDFEPIEYSWEAEKSSSDFLPKLALSLIGGANLSSDLPLTSNVKVIENSIANCRSSLVEEEIERFRELGRDTGTIVGNLAKTFVPGQSELEIARLTNSALAEKNITSIVTLIAADERLQKFRHPIPTARKWEKVLMIVVCAKRFGLITSLTRIICSGKIPDELRRRTEACAMVNAKLCAATKPGTSGNEFYQIAAEAYSATSFASEINLHHQGGATGYKPRDWVAHPNSNQKAQTNQAFAWNPSISGTKIEETIICFEDETQVISGSPDWAQISLEIDGREYLSPDVLSL